MFIFFHRLFFMTSRAVFLFAIPFVVLMYGPGVSEHPDSSAAWLKLGESIFGSLVPILIFKYILRVKCPTCGAKMDRDIIGSGNYECNACGSSIS